MLSTIALVEFDDVGSHGNDLADRLVAEDSGEWSCQVSERLVYVGVADAACMHLHEHLIRSELRLRNVFDLPRTIHSGNDRSLHKNFLLAIRCERLCHRCMILDVQFANRPRKLRLTVPDRIVGDPEVIA